MNEVKHAGCKRCKSKEQEVLTSILIKGEYMGEALCDKCLKEQTVKNKVVGK